MDPSTIEAIKKSNGPFATVPQSSRDLAVVFFAATTPLAALAIITFLRRVYIKVYPAFNPGWDDLFIVVGFVSALFRRETRMGD